MDRTHTGVVDRIVDGETAVILLEADGDTVAEETVPAEELPAGAGEGSVLAIVRPEETIESMELDEGETERRREAAQERFDSLSQSLSDHQDETGE